jgi:Domain of unknown function (DUF4386)
MSTATFAGLLLIVMPVAFNVAFGMLAARFDYPDILRRHTDEVRSRFEADGTGLVLLWWSFAMTAVLFAPLVVLLSQAIVDADQTQLALATTVRRPRRDRAVPRVDPVAVPRALSRTCRIGARRHADSPGSGRRRLPVLQPVPRRRHRRAPRLRLGRRRRWEIRPDRLVGETESASWLGGVPSAHVVHAETDQAEVVPILRVTPRDE